jgi:hypothetical protein
MSTGATPPAAGGAPTPNSPPAPRPADRPPEGGLKSSLKVAVPLLALVGVVFAVTYFAQYVPPEVKETEGNNTPTGSSGEPPLRFFTSTRAWDPPRLVYRPDEPNYRNLPLLAPSALPRSPEEMSERAFSFSLPDRVFQGFYEPGETLRATQFWFENRNPAPVTMQLKGVSCSACTGGRLAAIPPETTRNLFQHAALAALPVGSFNPYGVGLTQPLANLSQLQWTGYQFKDNPQAQFHVPAAPGTPDPWAPQWGILELTFKVNPDPKLPLRADFAAQVDGAQQPATGYSFLLMFEVSKSCVLSRSTIDVGTLDPLSGDREYEVLVYSSTRGPGSEFGDLTLSPQDCLVQAPAGATDPAPFVEVTKVARVPEAELPDVTERLAAEHNRLTKVRSAYRVTVAVRPKVGEHRLDIGLLERTVLVTADGGTQTLQVKGAVRGPVWLDTVRNEIQLGSFAGSTGHTHQADLTTEKAGLELALVKDECQPRGFVYELEKQPDRGGQGHYRLKVTVPPGQVFGQIRGGVAVLEVKGPTPQRIRIPVSGSGRF